MICLAIPQPVRRAGGVEILVSTLASTLSRSRPVLLASADRSEAVLCSELGQSLRGHMEVDVEFPQEWTDRFIKWLRVEHAGLVHFHCPGSYAWRGGTWNGSPIAAVSAVGFPVITTNHQVVTPWDQNRSQEPLARRVASFLKRWPGKSRLLQRVRCEVYVSDHDLHCARRLYPTARRRLMRIYHSRIDLPADPPVLVTSKEILSLAAVCKRKGQQVLVEAFASLVSDFPDWTLRLVGPLMEGPVVERIRARIEEDPLKGRVTLEGPSACPLDELARSEIYVQPSLLEGLGLSVQEAMACGRPCIGSRVGGIPELIDDEVTGYLVAPGSSEALADALRRMIEDRESRERLGCAGWGRLLEKGMTREGMIEEYEDLYRELTQR